MSLWYLNLFCRICQLCSDLSSKLLQHFPGKLYSVHSRIQKKWSGRPPNKTTHGSMHDRYHFSCSRNAGALALQKNITWRKERHDDAQSTGASSIAHRNKSPQKIHYQVSTTKQIKTHMRSMLLWRLESKNEHHASWKSVQYRTKIMPKKRWFPIQEMNESLWTEKGSYHKIHSWKIQKMGSGKCHYSQSTFFRSFLPSYFALSVT